MNRFKSIPSPFSANVIVDYTPTQQHDDSRIVDDSHYVPNHRANQILAKQFASQMLDKLAYDNPADIKSGAVNVYARQKGRDIAELTQQMRSLEPEVTNQVNQSLADLAKSQTQAQAQSQAQAQASSAPAQ